MNSYIAHLQTPGAMAYAAKLNEALSTAIESGDKNAENSLREQINQFFATEANGQAGIPMAVMA